MANTTITATQRARLTIWMDRNKSDLEGKTWKQMAKYVTSKIGFAVPTSAVSSIGAAIGIRPSRHRTSSHVERQSLNSRLRRVEERVDRLYADLDLE